MILTSPFLKRGQYEAIQDLICQAFHKKFSIRKHTILFRLKTHSERVRLALQLMALGVDISALEKELEIRESTLRILLARSGVQARMLHKRFSRTGVGECAVG